MQYHTVQLGGRLGPVTEKHIQLHVDSSVDS